MLIVTTIVAVVGGRWLISARDQRNTLRLLRKLCAADALTLEIETGGVQRWFNHEPSENTKDVNHFLSNVSAVKISSNSNGWTLSTEIVECLAGLPSLKSLRLSGVEIPRQALALVEQMSLEELELLSVSVAPQLDHSQSIGLPRSLRRLKATIWNDDLSLFSSLGQLEHLREIETRYVELTDDHMAMLCSLAKLKSIELHGSMPISPDGLAEIGNLKHLTSLAIHSSDAYINNSVLAAIATLPKLKTLAIPTRGVHGNPFGQLAKCKSLDRLQLVGCTEDDTQLSGLSEIKSLKHIAFEDWGKPVSETIFGYLRSMDRLETIYAGSAGVSIRGAKRMLELPSFTNINGTKRDAMDRNYMHFLNGDPRGVVKDWSVDFSDDIDVSGQLGFLKTANQVLAIDLTEADIDDSDMKDIAQTPNLRQLSAKGASVTDAGVAHLRNATQLKTLILYDVPLTCEEFPAIKNLDVLYLDGNRITSAGWQAIGQLPNLRTLSVRGATINADAVSKISKIASLETLTFSGCDIEANALAPIASHSGLTSLFLFGPRLPQTESIALKGPAQLRTLMISNTQINYDLIESLAGLQNLRQIDLRQTNIGDSAVEVLASLPLIDLVQLYNTKFTLEGKRRLRAKLGTKPKIDGTNEPTITDKTIASFLRTHHGSVWLPDSLVTDVGIALLTNCDGLYDLDLTNTKVGDEGMKTIAKVDGLSFLCIQGTLITDAGIKALQPLSESIEFLNLSRTAVTPAAVKSLAALRLKNLILGGTTITLQQVVDQMPENELHHLVTSDCDLHINEIRYVFASDKRYSSSKLRLHGPWWNWERVNPMVGNRFVQEVAIRSTSLDDKSIDLLLSFPFLRLIHWIDELPTTTAFSRLRECRFLHKMQFENVRVTQSLIDEIALMPHLRQIEFDNAQELDSIDLSPLTRSKQLQTIKIISRKENLQFEWRLKKLFRGHAKIKFEETVDDGSSYDTGW